MGIFLRLKIHTKISYHHCRRRHHVLRELENRAAAAAAAGKDKRTPVNVATAAVVGAAERLVGRFVSPSLSKNKMK